MGRNLGKTSVISGGAALLLVPFFYLIQSIFVGPLESLTFITGFGLALAPIAIITGLSGIKSDEKGRYAIIGLIMGVFIIMYYFMALTPLFAWIPR